MKKIITPVLMLLLSFSLFAQNNKDVKINPVTGFPEIEEKPFITFEEGLSGAFVTRIEKLDKEDGRSNFVRENFMVGAYCEMSTVNIKPFDYIVKLSAYYPYHNTFNGMKQYPKQILLYAVDFYAGPSLHFDAWKYVKINLSAGFHYMYQLSDEFHLNYIGAAVCGEFDYPITKNISIKLNGQAALDYPNFGTNRIIQPYDYSWQYHVDIGFKYTKHDINTYSYIQSKKDVQNQQ